MADSKSLARQMAVLGPASGPLLDWIISQLPKKDDNGRPPGRAVTPPRPQISGPPAPPNPSVSQTARAAVRPPVPTTSPPMSMSDKGAAFLKDWEKFSSEVYTSDGARKPTIGYGHLVRPGEDFSKGLTRAEGEALFQRDLEPHVERVRRAVKVPLKQAQFDALVSLSYNFPGAFAPGTGLMKALNAGDFNQAAAEILRWDKAHENGKVITPAGLPPRRRSESNLFSTGIYDSRH